MNSPASHHRWVHPWIETNRRRASKLLSVTMGQQRQNLKANSSRRFCHLCYLLVRHVCLAKIVCAGLLFGYNNWTWFKGQSVQCIARRSPSVLSTNVWCISRSSADPRDVGLTEGIVCESESRTVVDVHPDRLSPVAEGGQVGTELPGARRHGIQRVDAVGHDIDAEPQIDLSLSTKRKPRYTQRNEVTICGAETPTGSLEWDTR